VLPGEEKEIMPKITKRLLESLKGEQEFTWDSEVKGFGVRARKSGAKSYIVQYRFEGRQRKYTIGKCESMAPSHARREAAQILSMVNRGIDPAAMKQERRAAPTLKEFSETYLTEYAQGHKKESSVLEDTRLLEKHVFPAIGNHKVRSISQADVSRLHSSLSETPYQANRVLALLSKVFNLAEKWGYREDKPNPCRHVDRYREESKERYLSTQELERLGTALTEAEKSKNAIPSAIAAIRLLIFTGCRKNEILRLKWEHVDFERACLRLPDSKTGQKVVYLNVPALNLLNGLERVSEWVIPGDDTSTHLVNLNRIWSGYDHVEKREGKGKGKRYHRIGLRDLAGLPDVRLHDLRHSFASVAAGAGLGLPIIGKLLGHTQAATTAKYAHLADDPMRQAAEEVGKRIAEAMKGSEKKVIHLNR